MIAFDVVASGSSETVCPEPRGPIGHLCELLGAPSSPANAPASSRALSRSVYAIRCAYDDDVAQAT